MSTTTSPALLRHLDRATRTANPAARQRFLQVKPARPAGPDRLRADRASGAVLLNDQPLFHGLPDALWRYELGGRAVVEHLLGEWNKQVRPAKDPTLARFFPRRQQFTAEELNRLFDLIGRAATTAAETTAIVDGLAAVSPLNPASRDGPLVAAPPAVARAVQLALDFAAPPRPAPATFTLALTPDQSAFYLEHLHGPHEGDALECLLDLHGHTWDERVDAYDTTQYWQGAKNALGSRIATLVLVPGQ